MPIGFGELRAWKFAWQFALAGTLALSITACDSQAHVSRQRSAKARPENMVSTVKDPSAALVESGNKEREKRDLTGPDPQSGAPAEDEVVGHFELDTRAVHHKSSVPSVVRRDWDEGRRAPTVPEGFPLPLADATRLEMARTELGVDGTEVHELRFRSAAEPEALSAYYEAHFRRQGYRVESFKLGRRDRDVIQLMGQSGRDRFSAQFSREGSNADTFASLRFEPYRAAHDDDLRDMRL